MALKCDWYARQSKLGVFYSRMKAEINRLGANIRPFVPNYEEYTDALEKLKKAKDRDGNELNMSIVGISTGVFVPYHIPNEKDWLLKAHKVALEHAKTLGLPKKNMTAIYFETRALIPDEKVQKCLEKSVYRGWIGLNDEAVEGDYDWIDGTVSYNRLVYWTVIANNTINYSDLKCKQLLFSCSDHS